MSINYIALLGDVADVQWGDTSVTKASYVNDGHPAYSASGPDGYLPYADFDRKGIVLSAIGARCGKTWFAEGKWSCIKNTIRLWSKTDALLDEYLYWATSSPAKWPKRGAAQPFITLSGARRIPIKIPPLPEQRRLIDVISRADSIVRTRREAEQKSKEIIPALFMDMFAGGSGEDQHVGRRREPDPIEQLGNVAEVVSGVAKGRKLVGKITREVPYLRVANVQAGGLDLSEMKYIPATVGEIDELAVRAGDVLLTEGGDFDKVGRGALLENDIGECIHQNHVFRVRVQSSKLVPEYFAAFLQTFAARKYFLKAAKKTSNLASINMTQLKNLPLPLPRLALQAEFQTQYRVCRSLVVQQSRATAVAESAFQSLLAGVFGEGH